MTVKKTLSVKRQKVLEVLNKARSMELFAIGQYLQQHYRLDDDNYTVLASAMKKIGIEEMKHAEALAERIRELDGVPTQDRASKVVPDQDVYKIYPYDSDVELDTLDKYNEFVAVCRDNGDAVSMRLFEGLLEDEQRHQSYFDDVATHIKTMDKSFLAKVAGAAQS